MGIKDFYCNKDRRRGKITARRSEATSLGLAKYFEDPIVRLKRKIRQKALWDSGPLTRFKVVWTKEMDSKLIELHKSLSFKELRTKGAKIIGVSDGKIRERLKHLGLSKPRPQRKRKIKKKQPPESLGTCQAYSYKTNAKCTKLAFYFEDNKIYCSSHRPSKVQKTNEK